MYLNTTVKIPDEKGKIITKKKGDAVYILYQYGSEYNPEKRYAVPLGQEFSRYLREIFF